jgi:hypothetical protein
MLERVGKKGDGDPKDANTNFINIHLPNIIQSSSLTDINNSQQQQQQHQQPPQNQLSPKRNPEAATDENSNDTIYVNNNKEELKLPDTLEEQNYNLYYDHLLESYVNKQDHVILEDKANEHMLPLLSRRTRSEANNYASNNENHKYNNSNTSNKLVALEKHSLTAKTGFDMNSVGERVLGAPLTNGFTMSKINPGTTSDLSYLNRNKLINRRLTIRKHIESSSGLHAIIKPNSTYNKTSTGFRIANPELLEELESEESHRKSGDFLEKVGKSRMESTTETHKESTSTSRLIKEASSQSLARAMKKSKSIILIAEK